MIKNHGAVRFSDKILLFSPKSAHLTYIMMLNMFSRNPILNPTPLRIICINPFWVANNPKSAHLPYIVIFPWSILSLKRTAHYFFITNPNRSLLLLDDNDTTYDQHNVIISKNINSYYRIGSTRRYHAQHHYYLPLILLSSILVYLLMMDDSLGSILFFFSRVFPVRGIPSADVLTPSHGGWGKI